MTEISFDRFLLMIFGVSCFAAFFTSIAGLACDCSAQKNYVIAIISELSFGLVLALWILYRNCRWSDENYFTKF